VIQFADEGRTPHAKNTEITGYNCGQKGHKSRDCKRQTNLRETRPVIEGKDSGNESGLSQNGGQPTVRSTLGCICGNGKEYVTLNLNISEGKCLLFLIDTADLSLVKVKRLRGSTLCNPGKKVKAKSVEGSEIEIFASVEAKIQVGDKYVPLEFQLVNT
jgi:hypothetical protein